MRLKSRYRKEFKDGGRVDLSDAPDAPPVEQPTETVSAPPEAPAAPEAPAPRQDDATLALKREIERLRQSEQVQRQQAQPQQPMTREQRLAAWQAQGGLSPAEVEFFNRNPAMLDHPEVTGHAVQQALQAGHQRGTDAHFATVEKIFNHLTQAATPEMQPTPEFFSPPPSPPARSEPNPSSLVSAPVSRSIPSASGKRHQSPGKVTLTPSEVEAARLSGVTIEEYARQKLKYDNMRETGEYRDNRDQR